MGSRTSDQGNVTPMPNQEGVLSQTASMATNLSMYLSYFGLKEAPFTITPDPRYLFLSRRHQEGLAHLLFGVGQGGSGGFVQLTGEVGTGKTTLCRCLLDQVPERTRIALILNPVLTPVELLATICDELGLDYENDSTSKMLMDQLTEYLLQVYADGERVVVVIDEAQNLSREALEQVRLLTNLETATDKLLQIVLLGQPELRQLLANNDLRQLAQRITARYHLEPLDAAETAAYIKHRMAVAGAARCPFTSRAMKTVHQYAHGVPRLINIICDRALMGAFANDKVHVTPAIVRQAAHEVKGEGRQRSTLWPKVIIGLLLLVAVGVTAYWHYFSEEVNESGPLSTPLAAEEEATMPEPLPAQQRALPQGVDNGLLWQRYGQLWRSPTSNLREICINEVQGPFFCIRQSGTWQRLKRLGVPVLLILENHPGLLLLGIRDQDVLVHDGRGALTLPKRLIEANWLGEFWAVAPGQRATLRTQEISAEVHRLKSLAAGIAGMPYVGPLDERFDPSLEHWVKAFQRQRGINADGIVGPTTRLYLVAEAVSEPRLLEDW